jgi:hypothetical protein
MGHVFKHPKYYKQLKEKYEKEDPEAGSLKSQATSRSFKRQAASFKHQASSIKLRQKIFYLNKSLGPGFKLQAVCYKLPDTGTFIKFWNLETGI